MGKTKKKNQQHKRRSSDPVLPTHSGTVPPPNRFVSLDNDATSVSNASRTSRQSRRSTSSNHSRRSVPRRQQQVQSSQSVPQSTSADPFQAHLDSYQRHQQDTSDLEFNSSDKTVEILFRHDSNLRSFSSIKVPIGLFLPQGHNAVDDLHSPFFKSFLQNYVIEHTVSGLSEEVYQALLFAITEDEFSLCGRKNGENNTLVSAFSFNKYLLDTIRDGQTLVIALKFFDDVTSLIHNSNTPSKTQTAHSSPNTTPVVQPKPATATPNIPSVPVLRPQWHQTPSNEYWNQAHVPSTCSFIPSPSYRNGPHTNPLPPSYPNAHPSGSRHSNSSSQYNTVPPSPAKNPMFPNVNTPVQLRMEALGKESFDPKTFANSVSTLKIAENTITGMQKLYARLTGAVASAVKSPRKVFPAFNTLTQSTNLVEEMLGPVQTTAVYTKAVDNYNIISHQFHLLLTNSDIFDTCMTEARNIITSKGLITECGFQLLFLILQEHLPSLGATPFNVTDEINKLKIERGETLQSLYEQANAIDISLQLSQQIIPIHDLLSKFITLLMNTREYASFLHYKASEFNSFIKVYKNHPYYETFQSIYDYLKPLMSTDTPLTLIRSNNEASTTVLESNSATHQKQPHIDARHLSGSKDKQNKEKGKQRFRHPQCRICGRRHPENQCAYLPKEYQPKILLQNADRFLKMNPTVKPNPDWVNKTDFPPITSSFSKSTNVTEQPNMENEEIDDDDGFYDVNPEASSAETQLQPEVGLTEIESDYFDDCVFDYYNPNTDTDIEVGLTEALQSIVPEANLIELQQSDVDTSTSDDSVSNLIDRPRSDDSSDDDDSSIMTDESIDTAILPNLVQRVDTDESSTDTETTTSLTDSTVSDHSHKSSTTSKRLPIFIQIATDVENNSNTDEQFHIHEASETELHDLDDTYTHTGLATLSMEQLDTDTNRVNDDDISSHGNASEWLFPQQDNGTDFPAVSHQYIFDEDTSVLSMTHLAQLDNNTEIIAEDDASVSSSSDISGLSQVSSLDSLSSSSSEQHSIESRTTYQSVYTDDHKDLSVNTNEVEQLHHDRTAVYNFGQDQAQSFINLGHLRERYNLRHYIARMNRAHDLLRRFMDLRKFRQESHPEAWTTHDDTFIYQLLDTYFHMGFSLSPVEAQHPRYVEDLDVDLSIPHHHPTHELQDRFDTLRSNTERFLAHYYYPYYPRLPYPDSFLRDKLAEMETRLDEFIEIQNRRVSILTPNCPTVQARRFFSSTPNTINPEINMAETITPLQSVIITKHKQQHPTSTKPLPQVKLLVDTGANCNVFNRDDNLYDVTAVQDKVRQSGGTYTSTTHTGKAIVDLGTSITTDFIVVPSAPRNILSPRYLKKTLGFKKCAHDPNDSFIIIDQNDNYISIPYLPKEDPSAPTPYIYVDNGLDILVTTFADLSFESNSGEQHFNKAFFYHCAWNHTNIAQDVIKHQSFEGLPKHIPVLPFPCPICKAMKPRTPSPGPMIDYDKFAIGEYQAMDYTFFDKTSIRGYTSALHIVDGKTGKAHTFGTRHKRAPLTLATWFLNYLDRIGRPCKIIRTDKGGELARNTQFCKMVAERGISLQDTAGYSSHKNGKVEALHRPLKNAIRAMIMHAPPEVDETFWCYAMDYADYVSARLPRRGKSRSPYQLWHNQTPKASDIHIWGCNVYECIHNPKSLDQRGHRGYFLGYANTTKNVLAYFPDTHKVRRLGKAIFDDYNVTLSPTDSIAPVTHLIRNPHPDIQLDNVIEPKVFEMKSPFQDKDLHTYTIKLPRTGLLRLTVIDDDTYGIPVIQKMGKTSPFYQNLPYRFRKNAFIVSIHDDEPITADRVYEYIEELRSRDIFEFEVQLARHPTNYASEFNQLQKLL